MFRAVYTLSILATGLPLATAAELKHVGDVGKVRQVVSLLQGISRKLSSEREKENVVYNEIKRYCENRGANLQAVSPSEIQSDSENLQNRPQDAASTPPSPTEMKSAAIPLPKTPKPKQATVAKLDAREIARQKRYEATAKTLDDEDPSMDITQMNALLDAAEGKQTDASADDSTTKNGMSGEPTPKRHGVQDELQSYDQWEQVDRLNELVKVAKPALSRHDNPYQLQRRKHDKPISAPKADLDEPEQDDSASVDQLTNVVKAAVTNDLVTDVAQPQTTAVVQQDKKPDSADVDRIEPLASTVLAIDDTAQEDAGTFGQSSKPLPQDPRSFRIVPVPERPHPEPLYVDPQIKAVQSEFDETKAEVANMEKDFTPVTQTVATLTKQPDPAILANALTKAQQQEQDDMSVAAMSEAFGDLKGAIPNIDQQALTLYNSFGGEPASVDALGGLGAGPSFLQVAKNQRHPRDLGQSLPPVMRTDLDAAWDALRDVAQDTLSAFNMMDTLRNTDDAGSDTATPGSSSIDDQCTLVLKNFERRQAVRSKKEAELEKRSQRLLQSLPTPTGRDRRAKHLRSHN